MTYDLARVAKKGYKYYLNNPGTAVVTNTRTPSLVWFYRGFSCGYEYNHLNDNKELEKSAEQYAKENETNKFFQRELIKAYKAGYCKAIEEL